jgi:hypothetical protein
VTCDPAAPVDPHSDDRRRVHLDIDALRVLGRMRTDETFSVVWRRFAPWMWCGLVVMA